MRICALILVALESAEAVKIRAAIGATATTTTTTTTTTTRTTTTTTTRTTTTTTTPTTTTTTTPTTTTTTTSTTTTTTPTTTTTTTPTTTTPTTTTTTTTPTTTTPTTTTPTTPTTTTPTTPTTPTTTTTSEENVTSTTNPPDETSSFTTSASSAATSSASSTSPSPSPPSTTTGNVSALTTTTTTTTTAILQRNVTPMDRVSVVHQALQYSQAVQVSPQPLSADDFVKQYCDSDISGGFHLPAAVGSSGLRYTQAAQEQLNTMSVWSSWIQLEIGRIRKTKSFNPQSLHVATLAEIRRLKTAITANSHNNATYTYPRNDAVFGTCKSNSDCAPLSPRIYCIDSVCRECSGLNSTLASDCPNSSASANMCRFESNFTCSECLQDSDCTSQAGVCRMVFPPIAPVPMMPRNVCVNCTQVPRNAEILNASTCSWRCPFGSAVNQDGSACTAIPVCSSNEFLGPNTADYTFYGPGGINMTDPVCKKCSSLGPVDRSDSCFTLSNDTNAVALGNLNTFSSAASPSTCNLFTCNPGWALNPQGNQCKICDPGMCPQGQYLASCGGSNPGHCLSCTSMQPTANMTWIDYYRANISNASNLLPCGTVCRNGFYRVNQTSCLSCSELQPSLCGPGSVLVNCGPGRSTGTCQDCSGLGSRMYWTGNQCQQASCASLAATCPPGTTLQGCGGKSKGSCVPCPFAKPANAIAWKASGCNFTCNIGSFVNTSSNACVDCNTLSCPLGQYLAGCGIDGVSQGSCTACQQLGLGLYFSKPNTCSPARCDSTVCSRTQKLVGCGYGEPGTCVDCGQVPHDIHFFTRLLQIGAVIDCAPGCNSTYTLTDDSSNPIGYSCKLRDTADFMNGFDFLS